jgi:PPP family 3-phenylpropionic acid transporter
MLLAQVMHAATFGAFHAAAIHLVYHAFRGRHQGRGQALYSSLSFGAGGAVGSLWSGLAWEPLGPALTFTVATGVALASLAIGWRWIGRPTT